MRGLSMLVEAPRRPLAMRALMTLMTAVVLAACSNIPSAQDTNQADWAKYYKHVDEPQNDN